MTRVPGVPRGCEVRSRAVLVVGFVSTGEMDERTDRERGNGGRESMCEKRGNGREDGAQAGKSKARGGEVVRDESKMARPDEDYTARMH